MNWQPIDQVWDLYAAAALSGLLANPGAATLGKDDVHFAAHFAALLADALLAERLKRFPVGETP